MESNGNGAEKEEEIQEITSTRLKLKDFIPIYIPMINESDCKQRSLNSSERSTMYHWRFVRKIDWPFIIRYCKNWIKHPMNMALLVWFFFVMSGLVITFLLMTGILNHAIPMRSQRTRWTEITNQILNALYTIMSLYQYPKLIHQFVILSRWRVSDAVKLRQAYCKSATPSSYERIHMAVVIVLLHIACWSQYILCALYWAWTNKSRPDWAGNLCVGIGTVAPVIAGIYTVFSPLGKRVSVKTEATVQINKELQKRHLANETDPEWVGGPFDCRDDLTVCHLSFFCTFCVFGWNMERLGFGNMYVHTVTFVLLCIGPLLVFNVAALNIADEALRLTMRITGIVLCFLGLFYGGFWRTQMRRKFKLPGNPFCCGYQSVTDWMMWLFCCPCSLAQEVRTANFYDIEEGSFDRPKMENSSSSPMRMVKNSTVEIS